MTLNGDYVPANSPEVLGAVTGGRRRKSRRSRKSRKARRGGDEDPALMAAKASLRPTQTKCATRDAFNRCVMGGRRRTRRSRK